MTTFGIIWMLIVFFAFFSKDIKYMILVTLIGMIFQCNNVIYTSSGLSCGAQLITSFAFIIKSLKYRKSSNETRYINLKKIYFSLAFFLVYIIVNCLLFNNATFNENLLNLIQIMVYILAFYRMKVVSSYVDDNFIDRSIKIIAVIILVIGYLQLFVHMFNLPKNTIFQTLVYNDTTNSNIYYYKNHLRFYSTFMEPSFVAGLLVGFIFYFLDKKSKKFNDVVIIILLLIGLLMTFSSTAYGVFFILAVIYSIKKIKRKNTWIYIFAGGLVLVILALTTDVLDRVIFDKGDSASARVRTIWNNNAYESFLKNPLWGQGYKTLRASSIVLDIMGELGLVGLFLYVRFVWVIIKNYFKKNESSILYSSCVVVLSMFLAQIIACSDLDLCSFWLAMYFYALVPKKIKERNDK